MLKIKHTFTARGKVSFNNADDSLYTNSLHWKRRKSPVEQISISLEFLLEQAINNLGYSTRQLLVYFHMEIDNYIQFLFI